MDDFSLFQLVIPKSSPEGSKSHAAIKFVSAKWSIIKSPEVAGTPTFCIISKAAISLFDPLFFSGGEKITKFVHFCTVP